MQATLEQKHVYAKLEMLYIDQQLTLKKKYFISNCTTCNDYLQNNSKELLISHPNPSKPWSQIAMDIMTVFGRNYLITADTLELHTLANNLTAASAIQCSRPILEK